MQSRQCSDVICFLAPMGLGKTCLLKLARRQLQQKGVGFAVTAKQVLMPTTSILDLLSDASDALPPEGVGAKFRARLEQFNISAGPIGLGIQLGSEIESDTTAYSRLSRLLSNLGSLAMQSQVGVALVIDEAQALPTKDLELLMRVIGRLDDLPIAVLIGGLPKIRKVSVQRDQHARTLPDIWYQPLYPLSAKENAGTLWRCQWLMRAASSNRQLWIVLLPSQREIRWFSRCSGQRHGLKQTGRLRQARHRA